MLAYRQGDVRLVKVRSIPKDAKPMLRDKGRVVVAYGEATGHAHAFYGPYTTQYENADGVRYLLLPKKDSFKHEEHDTHVVKRGRYRIEPQREYSPEAIRRVVD